MNNEEFERKAEFIINQQAQFASDIQQVKEGHAMTERSLARTAAIIANLSSVTFEGFQKLTDSQALTDEKLRNLIAVVDRHISEGHQSA